MNSFLQSIRFSNTNKETLIKNAITTQLSQNVKELQLCNMEGSTSGNSLSIGDASNNLCSIIEAMFLHGLKDSFAHKARRVISNDVDERPEPNFWPALLIFSHRQIIDQITALHNITTEIGQCRAWIRFALNDSLLSSYFATIKQNSSALKLFYKTYAYVRDVELLDVAQRLIEGVEMCTVFTLPYNSTLLNSWPLPTLVLAGIWSPTLRQCPIASGVDVAQCLNNVSPTNSSTTSSVDSTMPLNSEVSELRKMLALNEDEALKIILSNTPTGTTTYSNDRDTDTFTTSTSSEETKSPIVENDMSHFQRTSGLGNSLNRKSGWSFDESETVTKVETVPTTPIAEMSRSMSIEAPKSTEHSYHALIESYNMISGAYIKTPNLQDVWHSFENKSAASTEICRENSEPNQSNREQSNDKLDFEFINTSVVEKNEIRQLMVQFGKLAQEKGLDTQNYECCGCKHPLSINVCKPSVCAFTGDCYCNSCMNPDPVTIPARIIHNWDFKQYYVSKKVATFINDVKNHPLLDMKVLNPYIYLGVEEMARLQTLRIQLNFLRDYLYTCRGPVIQQFQRLIWPKEYMYEHIHQYSVNDLMQIPGGLLADELQNVVKFGKEHVTACWLCSQKGFVCEICNKPKVLYPFDVETTYRCEVCNAVYHIDCLNKMKPCPKCKRKREREHLSLLDATLE